MITESKCEPEQLKGRNIFMSMYNDIDWTRRGMKENCIANALRVTEYARRFFRGEEMVRNPYSQTGWNGIETTEGVPQLCRKRTSCKSCHQCHG